MIDAGRISDVWRDCINTFSSFQFSKIIDLSTIRPWRENAPRTRIISFGKAVWFLAFDRCWENQRRDSRILFNFSISYILGLSTIRPWRENAPRTNSGCTLSRFLSVIDGGKISCTGCRSNRKQRFKIIFLNRIPVPCTFVHTYLHARLISCAQLIKCAVNNNRGETQHLRIIVGGGWVVFCLWSMAGKSFVRVVDLTVKNVSNKFFKPNTRTLYFCAYLFTRLIN